MRHSSFLTWCGVRGEAHPNMSDTLSRGSGRRSGEPLAGGSASDLGVTDVTPEEAAHEIIMHLEMEGFIGASAA